MRKKMVNANLTENERKNDTNRQYTSRCPKCNSGDTVPFESKYNKKGFFCDNCDNEWVILK